MRSTFPAEGVLLELFQTGNGGCFHFKDVTFVSGLKCFGLFIHRHNPKQKLIAIFMVTHEMFHTDHVCGRGNLPSHMLTPVSKNVVEDLVSSLIADSNSLLLH
ncbi:hypothetical protein TNCT_472901 [Trichonephila clavata]|uniref:Uncharacterized protein n=1 Tax=Trichonephila clavata TaxID=2740835 RepID=A0A8X6M3M0_TRICU|nr:hypothetical protein TNCT_472901 [Trichonephila clavata]